MAHSLVFYGDGISFWVVSGRSFWVRTPSWWCLHPLSQDGFQPEGSWEVGRTYGLEFPLSFWPFPNSSSWWQLVSSVFLTGTSCCKTTHIKGYRGVWPQRVVSASGSPNAMLSRFSCVRLCATPKTAAHQAPPSLGFSRQEHWSGLPFPSPMHESEKWKWSHSVMSNS